MMAFYIDDVDDLAAEEHGGSCCGMTHLFEFPAADGTLAQRCKIVQNGIDRILKNAYDDLPFTWKAKFEDGGSDMRHCIEVVITASQKVGWQEPLVDSGFTEVFSFVNSKSGNRCYVYLLETNRPENE